MKSQPYQPHIDGLRMLAVMSVLLFHFGVPGFSGGFVGVDVFLVISGFLITRLLLDELRQNGRISYRKFYLRRLRRLLPAALATILISGGVAALLFTPVHFSDFAKSAIAATFSVSNFYFWLSSGYFDSENIFKPLLHTWSLGVEEQFYLVWPFLLFLTFAFARRWMWILLVVFCAISLVLNLLFADPDNGNAAIYYLLPFRAFELGIGAMLALTPANRLSRIWNDCIVIGGLALVAGSVTLFTENTLFPSYNALVPCVGAAMLIHSGGHCSFRVVFENPVSVYVGRISYSLYLVHWPVVVFFSYWKLAEPTDAERILLVVISLVLGAAMHHLVEQPFRQGTNRAIAIPNKTFAFGALVATLATAALAWFGATDQSWMFSRFPPDLMAALSNLPEKGTEVYDNAEIFQSPFSADESVKVLVIGDSHALDLWNALYFNREKFRGIEFRQANFPDYCLYEFNQHKPIAYGKTSNCPKYTAEFLANPNLAAADVIFYSTRWWGNEAFGDGQLASFVSDPKLAPKTIYIWARKPQFSDVPTLIQRHLNQLDQIDSILYGAIDNSIDSINDDLRSETARLGLKWIDVYPAICDDTSKTCDTLDDSSVINFYDRYHWTMEGARNFGARIALLGLVPLSLPKLASVR